MPPREIAGRYRMDRRLGAGGMSTVYLAMDNVLERPVAVKLLAEHLHADEAFVARFRREALAVARLQHPNIVQVFDSGEDDGAGHHYIVMEFVDGPSGADLLRDRGRLEVERAVRMIRDACHGLDYAHRAGVVHRDVKPGNLLVSEESGTTKLADFGIAKAAAQTRITQVGSVLGTAAYLSPEQARGDEAGPASDIYSLGVCAYQFLSGKLPYEYGSLTELALKQQQEDVEPISMHRSDVPPELDRAILLCLEREADSRYPSTLDLARALDGGLVGHETDVTRRLATAAGGAAALDPDATPALGEVTAATEALRTRRGGVAAPQRRIEPQAPRPREPEERRDARGSKGRRRFGGFLTLLAVLLAGTAVALALIASGNDAGVSPVDQGDVQDQIQGIRDFIQDHAR